MVEAETENCRLEVHQQLSSPGMQVDMPDTISVDRALQEVNKALATQLVAHADVVPGLLAMKERGYTLVAFSNSSFEALAAQLQNAKVLHEFDDIVSVESVRKFKPAREC